MKFEEVEIHSTDDFVELCTVPGSKPFYTKYQILNKEVEICKAIDFQFVRPMLIDFLRRYDKAAMSDSLGHALGKYLILLSTLHFNICMFKPSLIASAAVYLENRLLKKPSYWNDTLVFYTGYNEDELQDVSRELLLIYRFQKNQTCKNKSMFKKFSESNNAVALLDCQDF